MNNDVIKVQLSCGVDYYKGEKGDKPVKGVDYFTEQDINEIIERIEAGEIDLTSYATKEYVANTIEGMIVEETDPTVPEWAKTETKPSYTANEVGALPADTPLFSGNYNDLSNKPTLFSGSYNDLTNKPSLFSGNYDDLTNKPTIPTVPVNVSAFYNDAGYLNAHQDLTDYATKAYVDDAVADIPTSAPIDFEDGYWSEDNGTYSLDMLAIQSYCQDMNITTEMIYTTEMDETTGDNILLNDKLAQIDDALDSIPVGAITVETDPTVPSWAKQASKPTYTAQEVGALPADTALFSGNYNDLSNKPTLTPAPIVIQATIAGQPTVDNNGNYQIPLAITSNNMAEAYAQFQTHPSTVGIALNLTAMGMATKMYMDCESFYRYEVDGGGYTYDTYGEFNDSSLSWQFGFEFHNITVYLSTGGDSFGKLTGVATVHQLASKANSADLATVATSGDYNDLTNKPTIPTAYTLPTATTSTLGGVKVDGTTITITDGVISATSSSGGGSYTAGDGIVIDNGEISVDFGNEIENGGFSFAQHYDNEDYYEYTTNMYPYEINITSYGEADPETGDQETKSISITGEGITFDDTGDTHTLGVSNGELVFDDSPIGSGGGSSYTAGDGIEIDANGVISRTDIGLTGMSLFASGFINNFSFGDIPSASTLSQLAENLKKYGISSYSGGNFTPTALNEAMGGTRYITQFLSGDIVPNLNWSVNTYNSTSNVGSWGWRDTPCFVIGQDNKIYGTTSFSKLRMLIGWNLGELIYLNGSQLSNLTTSTDIRRLPNLMSDMNNVIGDINTRIPSAPTTDGNYVLQATVADGAVVYDWVEVSVGGSY